MPGKQSLRDPHIQLGNTGSRCGSSCSLAVWAHGHQRQECGRQGHSFATELSLGLFPYVMRDAGVREMLLLSPCHGNQMLGGCVCVCEFQPPGLEPWEGTSRTCFGFWDLGFRSIDKDDARWLSSVCKCSEEWEDNSMERCAPPPLHTEHTQILLKLNGKSILPVSSCMENLPKSSSPESHHPLPFMCKNHILVDIFQLARTVSKKQNFRSQRSRDFTGSRTFTMDQVLGGLGLCSHFSRCLGLHSGF